MDTNHCEPLVDHLAEHDRVILDDFLPENLTTAARNFLKRKLALDEFKDARIRASADFQIAKSIRIDEIFRPNASAT